MMRAGAAHHAREAHRAAVAEYAMDLKVALRRAEARRVARAKLPRESALDSRSRATLMGWLVDVHAACGLLPETLFGAVALVDDVLARLAVPRRRLQLLGVAGLLIAAKVEADKPLRVAGLASLTGQAYTSQEIVRMEVSVLITLDFRVCRATSVHHLGLFQVTSEPGEAQYALAQYLLELDLLTADTAERGPAYLAAAAALLSEALLLRRALRFPASTRHPATQQLLGRCAQVPRGSAALHQGP